MSECKRADNIIYSAVQYKKERITIRSRNNYTCTVDGRSNTYYNLNILSFEIVDK